MNEGECLEYAKTRTQVVGSINGGEWRKCVGYAIYVRRIMRHVEVKGGVVEGGEGMLEESDYIILLRDR